MAIPEEKRPAMLIATMRPFCADSGFWPKIIELWEAGKIAVPVVLGTEKDFASLKFMIPEAVCVPRGFFSVGFDFEPPSQSEFEALSRVMLDDGFPALKRQVLAMLNRHDSTGTFRLVDREVLFFQLFFGLGSLMIRKRVTHVFFDITPHVVSEYLLYWLAKKIGAQVLFLQPIPVTGLAIPRNEFDTSLLTEFERGENPPDSMVRDFATGQLRGFKENLRGGDATWVTRYLGPEMKKVNIRSFQPVKKARQFLSLARKPNMAAMTGVDVLPAPLAALIKSLLVWGHQASFLATRHRNSAKVLPDGPFLLYAMTHEPERTFFPEALPWESQLEFIALLASSQAGKRKIVVKEHETQYAPGRNGYASRSVHFYGLLRRLPNVVLISSELGAQEIIPASDGVVSATGTICVEAALSGKPGYYFGNPWWQGFPGTTQISSSNLLMGNLPNTDVFSEQNFTRWADALVNAATLTTSNISNAAFAAKFAELPSGYAEAEIVSLGALLDEFVGKSRVQGG